MYDITELVYGFDFSDGKYPDIGTELNAYVLDYIIDCEPFESPYSGHCEKPCYIGIHVTDYSLDDNIFDIHKEYEEYLKINKEKYNLEIQKKLDEVIKNLEHDREYLLERDPSLNSAIDDAITYFKDLKLCEPQNCSIKTTS